MLRAGQETFASALALIRVPEKKWRFLSAEGAVVQAGG